jgi:DNA-binding transcriptional ArsR family regulator
LAELERLNIIKADRKIRMTRYYLVDIPSEVSKVIGLLNCTTSRQILSTLVLQGFCTSSELAEITKKAPSTIFWHLKRLVENGVINKMMHKGHYDLIHTPTVYTVCDNAFVLDVLQKYSESTMDKIVNNYSQIIDNFS